MVVEVNITICLHAEREDATTAPFAVLGNATARLRYQGIYYVVFKALLVLTLHLAGRVPPSKAVRHGTHAITRRPKHTPAPAASTVAAFYLKTKTNVF